MTLLNFEDTTPVVQPATKTLAPVITETVTVKPTPVAAASDTFTAPTHWTWEQLRDYVVRSIEARHGAFPRNFKTEASIFKGFINRHGSNAGLIARYAFEREDGMWRNAPITPSRFAKGSDPYFAEIIAARLAN